MGVPPMAIFGHENHGRDARDARDTGFSKRSLRTWSQTKYGLDDRVTGVRRRMQLILPNGSPGRQAGDRLA